MVDSKLHNASHAGILRRLAAATYDWLLVIAVMIMTSIPFVAPTGEAIRPGNLMYQVLLVAIVAGFFVGFWSYRGQTPGMLAWGLRLSQANGEVVSIKQALQRFAAAIISTALFGLGFFWQCVDGDNLSWHDRWSGTQLRYTPRKPKLNNKS